MKANEFVKENSIEKCKRILDDLTDQGHNGDFYKDLKRLVESHELVEKSGGLDLARKEAHKNCFDFNAPLLKAIADVESCQ